MKAGDNFSILNTTNLKAPTSGRFLNEIKNFYLGEKYELSVVYINKQKSKSLNLKHRNKNKPANVLSFPLAKTAGEIFIDLTELEKQSITFGLSKRNFFLKLFIHALCHLKGLLHGSKMEGVERKIQARFDLRF